MMNYLRLHIFLILVCYCQQENLEIFFYKDRLMYFYPYKCTYLEANAICESENTRLVAFDDPDKTRFIKESLKQVRMENQIFWSSGVKTKKGEWLWEFNGTKISNIAIHNPSLKQLNCLAVEGFVPNPQFVGTDCAIEIPFMCEETTPQFKHEPYQAGVLTIHGFQFIMYNGNLTWNEAVGYCRQQGFGLSTILNMDIAQSISNEMLKIRPEFNEAWIGAIQREGSWSWVSTGMKITNTEHFPPWNIKRNDQDRNCAVLKNERWENFEFVKKKCNQLHNFICSITMSFEELTNYNEYEFELELQHKNKTYLFFLIDVTWQSGQQLCAERSYDMLKLNDLKESAFIAHTMYTYKYPIYHVWIGGKIIENTWKWIEDDEEILQYPDENGFPPWCDNVVDHTKACLNLDMKESSISIIYGLECQAKQAVVCSQKLLPV